MQKVSTKLRLKVRIKTFKKNQKLLAERFALCPWPPALLTRCDPI